MKSKDTPEKRRKREKLINRFDKDWYLDMDMDTIEIRRYEKTLIEKIKSLFIIKKHSIFTLYWWIKRQRRVNEEFRKFDFPFIENNIPPVKGIPYTYQLRGNWKIPESDLKYLYGGPLIDELGQNILVKHQSKFQKVISLITQLRPITWIITFLLFCYRFRVEIVELWNWVISFFNQ